MINPSAVFVFLFVLFSLAVGQARADSIKLDNAPISNVVRLFFAEVNQGAYVLPDELIQDQRRVSLSIKGTPDQLRANLVDILKGYGFDLEKHGGLYIVRKVGDVAPGQVEDTEVFIYRPKNRTARYLVDAIRHLYPGVSQASAGIPGGMQASGDYDRTTATAMLDSKTDRVIFKGTEAQARDLRRQLAQLDLPAPSIELQVFLIEHSKTAGKESGFSLLIDKLGPFSVAVGAIPASGDVLRIASGALDLAISALRSDNAFSVYTSPRLLLVDGKKARLVVGQDVPVLTSTTTTDAGIVQAIEYRSSGVIMEAQANILDERIEIDSLVEVSSFARTTTGVSVSPTLSKRTLQTSTILSDGSAVLFGGLRSANQNDSSTGLFFLPKFLRTNSTASDESELFVLMAAKRI